MKRLTLFMRMIAFLTVAMLLMVSVSAVEFYNTDGYYHATIYIKNELTDYQNEFSDAVDAWNSADITDRSVVVNTQSDSYINNFNFRESDAYFHGLNTLGHHAIYKCYSQNTTLACNCHKTIIFAIHLNDFHMGDSSSTQNTSTIAHEIGHAYGLTDLEESTYRYTSIMYAGLSTITEPKSLDVSNANACWAPHVN